jgi:hypothetical protein
MSHFIQTIFLGVITIYFFVPVLGAQEKSTDKKTADEKAIAQEKYHALVREYQQAKADNAKAFQEAKTEAERKKILAGFRWPKTLEPRMLKLAEDYPKQPAAVDAILWIVGNAPSSPESPMALAIFTKYHARSDKLDAVCRSLALTSSADAAALLRAIRAANPHQELRAKASFGLAQWLIRSSDAKSRKEADDLLEEVLKDHADIPYEGKRTLGETAKGLLFELRHLQIGMKSPDIEGEDIDGKKFRLSDYRGKVVVLHFWGSW